MTTIKWKRLVFRDARGRPIDQRSDRWQRAAAALYSDLPLPRGTTADLPSSPWVIDWTGYDYDRAETPRL